MAPQHDNELTPRGRLLIASPYAQGSPYHRAMVLLLEHDEHGAAGIVLDGSFRAAIDGMRAQMVAPPAETRLPANVTAVSVRLAVWPAGQLDDELRHGVWLSAAVDPGRLFASKVPDWTACVREVGRSVYRDALGIRDFPADPRVN